jgi:hypothetical protein
MSYQTGSASSTTVLLQTLVTWLVSIGWTQDRSASEGSGWTATLHKGSIYVNFRAAENEASVWQRESGSAGYALHMYLGTGYNGSNPFNNQAGGPAGAISQPMGVGMQTSAGPFSNYYFFGDSTGDNIVVVLERTPGLFVHLGWGASMLKAGSYTGGPYFFGSSSGYYASYPYSGPNTPGYTSTSDCPGVNSDGIGAAPCFVRADVDAFTGKWIGIYGPGMNGSPNDQGFTGKGGDTSVRGLTTSMKTNFPVYAYSHLPYHFEYEQTSELDGRVNLLPVILWVIRDSTTTGYSMLGTIPNVFVCNGVGNGFSNAEEYVLGSTTYKLFPNFAVVKQ